MKKLTLFLALLLLGISITEMVRWFITTAKDIPFDEMKVEYNSALPGFLQDNMVHTLLLILCSAGSAFLFLRLKNESGYKTIAKIGAVLGFLLAFWQLFSLM